MSRMLQENKNRFRAASAVGILLLLFFLLCNVYDLLLLFVINLIFNSKFVFLKTSWNESIVFFRSFIPNMLLIENFVIQTLSVITSVFIVSRFYRFKPFAVFSLNFLNKNSDKGDNFKISSLFVKWLPIIIAINFASSFIISKVIIFFEKAGINVPEYDFSFSNNDYFTMFIYFISLCVFAPLIEEFLIRGCIIGILRPYGVRFSVIISSLVFALLHSNMGQGFAAFFIGLVFGYITIKTGSIIPTIILHSLNNFFPFFINIIYNSEQNYNIFYLFSFLYFFLILSGFVLIIILFIRKKHFLLNGEDNAASYKFFFLNPFVIVYLMYEIYRFVFSFILLN